MKGGETSNRRLPPSRKHEEDDFMKKLIAIAVVFALAAGVAFAQDLPDGVVKPGLTVEGSAGATWVPFRFGGPIYDGYGGVRKVGETEFNALTGEIAQADEDSKGDFYTGVGGWEAKLKITGTSPYAGFVFGVKANQSGGAEISDRNFWVKPLGNDMLIFNFWKADGDLGMKNGGDFNSDLGDFTIKERFRAEDALAGYNDDGIQIYSKPVDGLGIGLMVSGRNTAGAYPFNMSDQTTSNDYRWVAANVWRGMQIGVQFQIPNIAMIRVGYFGGWAGDVNLNSLTDDQYNNLLGGHPENYFATGIDPTTTPVTVTLAQLSQTVRNLPLNIGNKRERAFFTGGFYLNKLVPGLEVDLGAKIFLPMAVSFRDPNPASLNSASYNSEGGVNLGLGFKYTMGDITLQFSASALQLGRITTLTESNGAASKVTKTIAPIQSGIYVGPSIKISDATVGFHFGVAVTGEGSKIVTGKDVYSASQAVYTEDPAVRSTIQYGFGAYFKKPFGKATFQAGVGVRTPIMNTNDNENADPTARWYKAPQDGSRFYISVPLKFSVGF